MSAWTKYWTQIWSRNKRSDRIAPCKLWHHSPSKNLLKTVCDVLVFTVSTISNTLYVRSLLLLKALFTRDRLSVDKCSSFHSFVASWTFSFKDTRWPIEGGFTQNPVYASDRQRLTVRFRNRLTCSGRLSHRIPASFRERLTMFSRNTSSSC